MAATLKAQTDLRDPAQTGLERQVSQLRRQLKSAEQRAASESMAHEDQAKLAEAMARAARAEARQREALACANAELAALVRSMEIEIESLRAEHAAAREQTPDEEFEDRFPADPAVGASPVREIGEIAPLSKRGRMRILRVAIAGLFLVGLCVAAILYFADGSRQEVHSGPLSGAATVISGDTLVIEGKSVRILGIAAPPAKSVSGRRATKYLHQLVAGQDVHCTGDGRRAGDDILARCFIGAVDIGDIMMLSGNAVPQ